MYLKVNSITVMPPSSFTCWKKFRTKTYSWTSHAELVAKQRFGFHCQRKLAFKFARTEPSGGRQSFITGTVHNQRYRL